MRIDGVCHCSPVFEGFSINNAIQRIDLGGRDVTKHLQLTHYTEAS